MARHGLAVTMKQTFALRFRIRISRMRQPSTEREMILKVLNLHNWS
jgi:hypothetical protein